MLNVLGWHADDSACGMYRVVWPMAALPGARSSRTLSGDDMLAADLTICQRVATKEASDLMTLVASNGGRLVYEADDLLWGLTPSNPAYRFYQTADTQDAIDDALEACQAVTVSTQPLADEFAALWHLPVHVLPNCLPDYMLDLPQRDAEWRSSRVTIGWAGSSTHASDMIQDASYGLRASLRSGKATFVSVGTDYRKALRVDGAFVPWSEDIEAFHRTLPSYDIGLCPLEHTRFNRSKSGIKAMEYQAAGVVPVATRCDAYSGVIEHGRTGFLCRNQKEWADALRTLVEDDDVRSTMSEACLELTAERTYSRNAFRWSNAYEAICA